MLDHSLLFRTEEREERDIILHLFTCLASRAVHLEMAYGLNVDSFINAFYGLPEEVLLDNGRNFVAADKELREMTSKIMKDLKLIILSKLTNKGVKWNFNPSYAPYFGGVIECMIKAAKRAINDKIMAILSKANVIHEELMIAFTGAEALLNSRSLTYQSANPNDDVLLTLNYILHGQIGGTFVLEVPHEVVYSPKKRWRRIQKLTRYFWHPWMCEWIPPQEKKWFNIIDIKVGDVVLMILPDSPRAHWPLARVLEVRISWYRRIHLISQSSS